MHTQIKASVNFFLLFFRLNVLTHYSTHIYQKKNFFFQSNVTMFLLAKRHFSYVLIYFASFNHPTKIRFTVSYIKMIQIFYTDSGLVFAHINRKPLHHNQVSNIFWKKIKSYQIQFLIIPFTHTFCKEQKKTTENIIFVQVISFFCVDHPFFYLYLHIFRVEETFRGEVKKKKSNN